ncbi:imidazole glycerol phosphate synthase subunit hisH [Trichodesmium erythraeum IMS101]|uniref:Imidazole glycerol phosphate synthase subunit HisH n=1 Tax=Trichodesmium erythraeum (strain IMS101) TaxID=203124 RepID=HIS5_TRIEI|nr:RecName: Full=Imidazole glycerol phosphate synthase subunit HisH; AltName: Full=IGP synthase glutaminase subunit; AltName: Full=IGP synthase subunit HisH; AltName: Full=ImGP synthase subunit HisH; Short=IGPS subunit HisH [Trichodesmium erythraeum IMS101]MBS9772980.1 imidazole glycerol phosphate synthase subunit HisH [Trichodesmium erythraeum GBRTRLIN201]MCH2049563.1 imidazole glycerol phosphate synthase subunit HisH [Trichodesmium sp. ALOHA_ZT_67]MDE5096191.1 imidazole glycerol phosphate synt
MSTIAVIDYDMGNLHSVCKGLEKAGATPKITDSSIEIDKADAVILPGVGSFDPAVQHLRTRNLEIPIKQVIASGKPFLGICLGLQILFESSEEGQEPGLGIFAGKVCRFKSEPGLTIPQMGWNKLQFTQPEHLLWSEIGSQPWVYFVHSYYVDPTDSQVTAATVTHGHQTVTAAVGKDNLIAVQFHPEKSSTAGLKILSNFVSKVIPKNLALAS